MTSIRAFAMGARRLPANDVGPMTALELRDRLNAIIACGEGSTEVEAFTIRNGKRVDLRTQVRSSMHAKHERHAASLASTATMGALLSFLESLNESERNLELRMRIPGGRGERTVPVSPQYRSEHGAYTLQPSSTGEIGCQRGRKPIVRDLLAFHALPHITTDVAKPLLLRTKRHSYGTATCESSDSLVAFRIEDIQIREDHVLLVHSGSDRS